MLKLFRLDTRKCLAVFAATMMSFVLFSESALALTVGENYTISIEKFNSDGSLTSGATSLGLSTTATGDSDGKLSFGFTSTIPNNTSCNFLVITIKNSSDAIERQTVVPCPDSGKALPLGVSGVTNKQAQAMISAFSTAASDDPILAVFGFTIIRSEGVTDAEIPYIATMAKKGISDTGGFVSYLTTQGVTTTQLENYRKAIVSSLADPDTGYCKLLKDSVDNASLSDATLEAAERGKASAKLMSYLVKAATTAGFSQDRILEAFNAMGAIAVPLIQTDVGLGNISAATAQSINSSVGGGIQKLRADRSIEKYSQVLSTLNASTSDIAIYTTAGNTLVAAMAAAFATFDEVFTGTESDTQVNSAQTAMDTVMQAAFNAFITNTAASNARIVTMIANIDTALGVSTGLTVTEFQYYKSNGNTSNWPIMMVIPVEYASSIKTTGGTITYTRDNLAIPAAMIWLGSCSNSSDFDKTSCEANSATWTAGRTTFSQPAPYGALFEIQEDVMIREFARFESQGSAGADMSQQNTLEKAFSDSLGTIAGNIVGTTDGSTSLSSAIKQALVDLMVSPQF